MISDKDLKAILNQLYTELTACESPKDSKIVLAKAVQLGIKYQTDKIKSGIDIVFKELES